MNPPINATNATASIEDLPPEMINELFRHLHPRDLVTCSMVNKRWHSIYTDFRSVDSLVEQDPYGHIAHRWYHSGQRIEEKELCDSKLFSRLLDRPLLSNLKRLTISAEWWSKFDLNKLNLFRQLVHLQIGNSLCVFSMEKNEKVILNLPKLEVLALWVNSELRSLVVDCPMLSVLIDEFHEETFELKHPETIRKLRGWWSGSELAPFKNVECLDTLNFQAITRDTLLRLPKLKELRYGNYLGYSFPYGLEVNGKLDKEKRDLAAFLDDVKALKGSDFKFIYAGFPLTKTMLDQIDFGVEIEGGKEMVSLEYIYTKNYHLFDGLDFDGFIDYNHLLENFSGHLPSCFFRKFTSISCLLVGEPVADADQLLWFLKSLGSVRRLRLEYTGLDQPFFDQLPASASLLTNLEVYEGYAKPEVDFNFISKLPYLVNCWFSQKNLSIKSLTVLVRLTFGKLTGASFHFGNDYQHSICKDQDAKWFTIEGDDYSSQTERDNPEQIFKWLEKIQKSEGSPSDRRRK